MDFDTDIVFLFGWFDFILYRNRGLIKGIGKYSDKCLTISKSVSIKKVTQFCLQELRRILCVTFENKQVKIVTHTRVLIVMFEA